MAFKKNGQGSSLGVVEIPDKTADTRPETEKAIPVKPATQASESTKEA